MATETHTFTDTIFLHTDLRTAVPVTITFERVLPDEINIISIIATNTDKNVMSAITTPSFKRLAETASRIKARR